MRWRRCRSPLTLGVGHVQVDCVAPFVLGRGGNAVTVSHALFAQLQAKSAGRELREAGGSRPRARGRRDGNAQSPLTLGMVFPFSNHNFDLRYWLAAAGVHPDRDVRLVSIPPPLMVDSLQAGLVDGFCVGEPWNSLAAARGLGTIVATQSQLFPRAVEKVLAMRTAFAEDAEQSGDAAAGARRGRSVGRRAGESCSARRAPRAAGVSRRAAGAHSGRARRAAAARRGQGSARSRLPLFSPPRRERAARSRWPLGLRADGAVGAARAEPSTPNAPPPECLRPDLYRQSVPAQRRSRTSAVAVRSHRVLGDERAGVSRAVRRAHAVRRSSHALTPALHAFCSARARR